MKYQLIIKKNENDVVNYINKMDDYINSHGLNMMMWNDSFHKSVINKYNKNILINYWSLSGEVSDKDEYNKMSIYELPCPN